MAKRISYLELLITSPYTPKIVQLKEKLGVISFFLHRCYGNIDSIIRTVIFKERRTRCTFLATRLCRNDLRVIETTEPPSELLKGCPMPAPTNGMWLPALRKSIKKNRRPNLWVRASYGCFLFAHQSHWYAILYQLAEPREKKKDQTGFWNQIIAFLTDTTATLISIFPIKF